MIDSTPQDAQEPSRGAEFFPARSLRQAMIADLKDGEQTWIAGRVDRTEAGGWILRDGSGSVALDLASSAASAAGDLVDMRGKLQDATFHISETRILAPGKQAPPAGSPNTVLWAAGAEPFLRRRRVREAVRDFFLERDFLEVETPVLVPAAGQEPHLRPFRTTVHTGAGPREAYLITSPEYAHKRLLTAGHERIFEMTRAFRNGPEEGRDAHWYEFAMLEWYRAYASYDEIMEDVENLVAFTAHAIDSPVRDRLKPPFRRLPIRDVFRECAGVDLEPFLSNDREEFAAQEAANGKFGLAADDPPDARFFKILVGGVEPELRGMGAVFLVDYPASQAALSKIKPDDPAVCERFELYADGMELANGFTELNDPVEQRRRFEEEARSRATLGTRPVAIDDAFLEALELGMPPAGGAALGLDRLMALLHGFGDIDPFLPFGRYFG